MSPCGTGGTGSGGCKTPEQFDLLHNGGRLPSNEVQSLGLGILFKRLG